MKKSYFEQHKKLRNVLRLLLALCVVFNYGALLITNALVVKENSQLGLGKDQFVETNPTAAKTAGLKTTPAAPGMYAIFIQNSLLFAFVCFSFYMAEKHISNALQAYIVIFFVIVFYAFMSRDFFNDLGYYIGWLIWK